MMAPVVNWRIDLGQIMTSLLLLAIGFGVRQLYKLAVSFVERVHRHDDALFETTEVVDLHSRSLLKAGLLQPPVKSVHLGRRQGDPSIIVLDDEMKT